MNIFAAQQQDLHTATNRVDAPDAASQVVLPRTLGFAEDAEDTREHRDLILMRLRSGRVVAVFADEAEMIVPRQRATPLPGAPAAICGVVSIRGRMYTLVDLERLFENLLPEKSKRIDSRPKQLEQQESGQRGRAEQNSVGSMSETDSMTIALRGDEQLALSVARVERIVAVPTDSLVKLARHAPFLRGVTEHDKQLILVLDTAKIFAHAAPTEEDNGMRTDRVRAK